MIDLDYVRFLAYCKQPLSAEIIKTVFQSILESGFHLCDGYAWPFSNPDNILTGKPIMDEQLMRLYSGNRLIFWRYPFEFTLHIRNTPDRSAQWMVSVSVDTLMGPDNESVQENTRDFLSILQICLESFETLYGYAPILSEVTTEVDIFEMRALNVYPIIYYGYEYVNLIGEKYLASIPAYLVEQLNQGFLIVSSLQAIYSDDNESLTHIREHLALNRDV